MEELELDSSEYGYGLAAKLSGLELDVTRYTENFKDGGKGKSQGATGSNEAKGKLDIPNIKIDRATTNIAPMDQPGNMLKTEARKALRLSNYHEKTSSFYNKIINRLKSLEILKFVKYEPIRYTTSHGEMLIEEFKGIIGKKSEAEQLVFTNAEDYVKMDKGHTYEEIMTDPVLQSLSEKISLILDNVWNVGKLTKEEYQTFSK